MEETLASPKMAEIDLINNLEKISSEIPNRILKLEGYILKENYKENLEILIFKGFSSSTTHPIEIDLEKKVIELRYVINNFKLYQRKSGQIFLLKSKKLGLRKLNIYNI